MTQSKSEQQLKTSITEIIYSNQMISERLLLQVQFNILSSDVLSNPAQITFLRNQEMAHPMLNTVAGALDQMYTDLQELAALSSPQEAFDFLEDTLIAVYPGQ